MGVAAYLFDLDGTLLDSGAGLLAAAEAVLREDRQSYDREQLADIAVGGSVRLLSAGFQLPRDHASIPELRRRFLQHYRGLRQSDQLFPGAEHLLQELQRRDLPWGIVTNKPREPTKQVLHQFPILATAGSVVSAEDAPELKPAPDGLQLACLELDVDPAECVYVGDFDIDYYAARAAGMRCLLIDPKQSYQSLGADWLCTDLSSAAELLLSLGASE